MTAGFYLPAFDRWREVARQNLQKGVPPECVNWGPDGAQQADLFGDFPVVAQDHKKPLIISKEFLGLATKVSCHSDPERWSLLYAAVWRLNNGEKNLLALATDSLVRRLHLLEKSVRRDAHKAKAFVRFRLAPQKSEAEIDHYMAWHRPDHDILPLVAPFFQRRFEAMRWTIMTHQRTAAWDGRILSFSAGVPESHAPRSDAFEDLWRTYYRATFNPARIKLKMMRREMPLRYWHTMPETKIISALLADAPRRVAAMIDHQEGIKTSAADFMPVDRTIPALKEAAKHCRGCPLYRNAHCTVFGAGPMAAKLMIIGEQPGDEEDKSGQAFVGPAGQLLNRALDEAGISRSAVYITNAVKHFKFEQRGQRRFHLNPNAQEINACRPWLTAEIAAVKPHAILTLGVTAGRSLFGPGFTLKSFSGAWQTSPEGIRLRATGHPAAILRTSDSQQKLNLYNNLLQDLRLAAN